MIECTLLIKEYHPYSYWTIENIAIWLYSWDFLPIEIGDGNQWSSDILSQKIPMSSFSPWSSSKKHSSASRLLRENGEYGLATSLLGIFPEFSGSVVAIAEWSDPFESQKFFALWQFMAYRNGLNINGTRLWCDYCDVYNCCIHTVENPTINGLLWGKPSMHGSDFGPMMKMSIRMLKHCLTLVWQNSI